ncbi:MAG: AsmA-like C-terminal region-containing protein [Bacteroidia bacterium]|nr:AsmA-like C-terminal region-containing protein [Bacteroidia bacterium]
MTWLVRILWLLLLIGALILTASATLTFLYKDKIQQIVLQSLAKNLNAKIIIGYLDVSFLKSWPNIEVELADVQISLSPKLAQKQHFSEKSFASCQKIYLVFDIIGFIKNDYTIKAIILKKSDLVFEQNKQTLWNVEAAISNLLQPDPTKPPSPIHLALEKLKITDSHIVVKTPTATIQCKQTDFSLSGNFSKTMFDLEASLATNIQKLKVGTFSYLTGKNIHASTKLFVDQNKKLYEIKNAKIQLGDLPIYAAGNFRIEELGINFDLSYGSYEATVTEFLSLMPEYISSKVSEYKASGKFQTEGYLLGYWGKKHLPEFKLAIELSDGEVTTNEKLGKLSKLNGKTTLIYSGDEPEKAHWEIEKLNGQWGKDTFALRFVYHDFVTPLILLDAHGKLDIAQVKGLLPGFHPEDAISGIVDFSLVTQGMLSDFRIGKYHKTSTTGSLSGSKLCYETEHIPSPIRNMNLDITFSNEKLHIDRCIGTIGQTEFQLLGNIQNPIPYLFDTTALLSGNLLFQSPYFYLSDFISKQNLSSNSSGTTSSYKSSTNVLSIPKNISFNLKTEFEKFTIETISGSSWVGEVHITNQCLYLDTLRLHVFGGKVNTSGVLCISPNNELQVACNAKLSQTSLKELFNAIPTIRAVIPPANYLSGEVNLDVALQTRLKSDFTTLLPSFSATGTIEWHNGSLIGYPTLHKLGTFVKLAKLKDLTFDYARASFSINNEIFNLGELDVLANKSWKVQASGNHTFDQKLSYHVKLFLPKNSWQEPDPQVNEWIETSPAPGGNTALLVHVSGTTDNPNFSLDTQAMKKQVQLGFKKEKEEIQKAFQQEKEEIFGKQSSENVEDWIDEKPISKNKKKKKTTDK